MRSSQIYFLPALFSLVFFCACSNESAGEKSRQDSVRISAQNNAAQKNNSPGQKGMAGIFDVPEMLALGRIDSAAMKDVPVKLSNCFSVLEHDRIDIGGELDESQGVIYYNNNPGNFKFECLLLIKKIPAKKPKHSQITVLEASKMLIYNYYGPYENTFKAYEEIKNYFLAHGNEIRQSGPMREFYPVDQDGEKDQAKWLTRIMVPVTLVKN